jgi:acetaldehyde dehydrogenase (acetylating)
LSKENGRTKVKVGIIGSGNIGTDLMLKLLRSPVLELEILVGIDPASEGLALARKHGVEASPEGIDALLEREEVEIVFDASGARPHLRHAPRLKEAGKIAVDLTPAAVGPPVVPYVNLGAHRGEPNINLITCGGQATIPIVWAIGQASRVRYAEIISSVASRSAGLGTRQNIDEFTKVTARSLESVGGAERGKAIIILNPAEPPILMRNTIFALVEDARPDEIVESIESKVRLIQGYVPGYRLKYRPDVEGDKVTVQIEVTGAGDYLPPYAGNLDIMTAAAVAVGEELATGVVEREVVVS